MSKLKLLVDDREAEKGYLMWDECPNCGSKDLPVVVIYNAEVIYHTTLDENGAIVIGTMSFIGCNLEDEYLECSECGYQIELGGWDPVTGSCIGVCITCGDDLEGEFDVVYLEDRNGKDI